MRLELKDKEDNVILTGELPVETLLEEKLSEGLGALSSTGSSLSKAELQEALQPLEDRVKTLTDDEKVALVQRVFDGMGRERYIEEGVRRGYISGEGTSSDDEEMGVLFSPDDHSGQEGWEFSDALQVWVKVEAKE